MPGRRARYHGTRWPLLLPARAGPNRSDAYCQEDADIYVPLDAVRRLMVPGPAPMMLAPGGYSPL